MDILPDGNISAFYIHQGEKVELCKIPETAGKLFYWLLLLYCIDMRQRH